MVGHPSLVLCWLHQDTLGPQLALAVTAKDRRCLFYQVRGSAVADPASHLRHWPPTRLPSSIDYRQIILGFQRDHGTTRWLSHAEISAGVIAAIDGADTPVRQSARLAFSGHGLIAHDDAPSKE